ncbi:MAG: hypothetical protein AABZ39_09255 [Spirochaetota bacterium]|mgnify:CR=1 FL=1
MKTAVSLPDALYAKAEKTAKRLGMTRSGLFAKAIEEFVGTHNPADITERLNTVFSSHDSTIDGPIHAMQSRVLKKESW